MATCGFVGNADMYGLGIRLGYYLQWYSGIFASVLARKEVPGARLALALFISATFLALVIQTVEKNLQLAEIYIILLLTFGAYFQLVPISLWKVLTCFRPSYDPSRFPLVDPGPMHSDLHTLLLLGVTAFQLWFWFARVPELDGLECPQYGFIFTKIRLNDRAFQVVNIVLYFLIGVIVLILCALRISDLLTDPDGVDARARAAAWRRSQRRKDRYAFERRVQALGALNFANNIITTTIIVVGVELSIKWNRITSTNSLSSAGQLIPFVIGLGTAVRILYVWHKNAYRISLASNHDPVPRSRLIAQEIRISRS